MGLSCPAGYDRSVAGQFVMVRPSGQHAPLLARPFSIYGRLKENGAVVGIELLIKIVGEGTRQLAGLTKGAPVGLLGPLGTGFSSLSNSGRCFLVAGGIGIAPIAFLATTMIGRGLSAGQCEVVIGGRSATDLVGLDRLYSLGIPVHRVTEDGSVGQKGVVTGCVKEMMDHRRPEGIYACGPHAMLAALAEMAQSRKIPCQVSIEAMMGCGMGVCLSCVVPARHAAVPYRHVCSEGPVFDSREIQF